MNVSLLDTKSPHAAELYAKLQAFVAGPCLEAEEAFDEFMGAQPPDKRWSSIPPVLGELQLQARELGLWNLFLIHEHSITLHEYGLMSELMGQSYLSAYATNCAAPDTGNMEVLHDFGTKQQKERYLRPLLDASIRSAFLMTEPEVASSDATNIATKFVKFFCPERNKQCYRISGRKWWSTGAMDPRCGVFIVMGQVVSGDTGEPVNSERHQSHTMLVVPSKSDGVTLVRPLTVFNYDDAPFGHAEVLLNDVVVPCDEALIKAEGAGFMIAQSRLGPGRIHHCMRAIGLARRCFDAMVERSLQRTAFKQPLLRHGMTQDKVASGLADLESARAITLICADKIDKVGAKNARDSIAMIKYAVPQMCLRIIDDAIQVYGGCGVSGDTFLAQAYSFMRTLRIADGPDEVHKMTVARIESKKAIERLRSKL
jgi:acyl-CoA dehydrogenase